MLKKFRNSSKELLQASHMSVAYAYDLAKSVFQTGWFKSTIILEGSE